MRVLVTGGTGFLGSHSVKALVDAGHEVRLLVRSPDRIAPALGPLGVAAPEHVVGDVTDRGSVRRALEGCDAVLHAASVFSYDPRQVASMQRANREGAEGVLNTAHELGLDPIVHVSSVVALLPARETLRADSPLGEPAPPYARSKAETERLARDLQASGAPVVITRPGMIWGPHDPHMGEGATLARNMLSGRVGTIPPAGLPVVDVRDVAAVHAATMEAGRGPRQFLATGEFLTFRRMFDELRAVTGRRLPALPVPRRLVLAAATAANAAQRVLPFRLPISHEAVWTLIQGVPADDSASREELGVTFRPGAEAIADTVRWLYEAGKISARQAGRVAT
jgi:dihydroflavonol-4-reductase